MTLPLEFQHWDSRECADYLGFSVEEFRRKTRWKPGFPKPLANFDEKRPRWAATRVMEWAMEPHGN